MIVDISGIRLVPGNGGWDCLGNGMVPGVECACEECDYYLCCWDGQDPEICVGCSEEGCPNRERNG